MKDSKSTATTKKAKVSTATESKIEEAPKKAKVTKKSSTPEGSEKPAKKKSVVKKNEEVIAEKVEREVLYQYSDEVLSAKSEGERQRRKKAFRQTQRQELARLLKKYQAAKKGEPKDRKEARIAIKTFAKERLTAAGIAKFQLEPYLVKKEKEEAVS